MNHKSVSSHFRQIIRAILVVALSGTVMVPPAFAKLSANTVNPTATVNPNGHLVRLTGPITCTLTQPVFLRVTVTQRSTGAVAEGYAYLIGTTQQQQWQVVAHTVGGTAFVAGPATVVAGARSLASGQPDDAHQWLVAVTLVAGS